MLTFKLSKMYVSHVPESDYSSDERRLFIMYPFGPFELNIMCIYYLLIFFKFLKN